MSSRTIKIYSPDESEKKLFYSDDREKTDNACVGHLRIDFGTGKEFWHSWWPHNGETKFGLNNEKFKETLEHVIYALRGSLLNSRRSMEDNLGKMPASELNDWKGLKVECEGYDFYLRCKPMPGNYDCYCYCYDKQMLEQALQEEQNEDIQMGEM